MNDGKTFNILVGIDYSELSQTALHEALRQATLHDRTVVHALHVAPVAATYSHGLFPSSPLLADGSVPRALERLQQFVDRRLDEYRLEHGDLADGQVEFISHIRIADPSDDIPELARVLNADLIIVGTHGRTGLARLLLGSVARDVVTAAPCPVLVVREPSPDEATENPQRDATRAARAA